MPCGESEGGHRAAHLQRLQLCPMRFPGKRQQTWFWVRWGTYAGATGLWSALGAAHGGKAPSQSPALWGQSMGMSSSPRRNCQPSLPMFGLATVAVCEDSPYHPRSRDLDGAGGEDRAGWHLPERRSAPGSAQCVSPVLRRWLGAWSEGFTSPASPAPVGCRITPWVMMGHQGPSRAERLPK